MKTIYLTIAVLLFCSLQINAQKLIPGDQLILIEGSFIGANGYSLTKDGIFIPYSYYKNRDSVVTGYKYQCTSIDSIQINDEVILFISYLEYNYSIGTSTYADAFGEQVFAIPQLNGAWKNLKILEKSKIGNNLILTMKGMCILNDHSVINTLSLKPIDGDYLIDNLSLSIKNKESIITMLNSSDSKDRREAALILGELKDKWAVDPLIHALKYDLSYQDIKNVLDKINPGWMQTKTAKNEVLVLIDSLHSPSLRAHSAVVLGDFKDQRAVGPLIIALQYLNSYYPVLGALEKIKTDWESSIEAKNAVPTFAALLDDKDKNVRAHAFNILSKIKDDRVLPNLIIALKYNGIYSAFADTLNRIKPDWNRTEAAKSTIPVFIKLLVDEDATIRNNVGGILSKLDTYWMNSESAKNTVPYIISVLKSNNSDVRTSAATLLGKLRDDQAIEPLITSLEDGDMYARIAAAEALENFNDKRAVEHLIKALHYNDSYKEIKEVLDNIDKNWTGTDAAKIAAPVYMNMLNSREIKIRREAAKILGEIKDNRAVELLVISLSDKDEEVRDLSAKALSEIKDLSIVDPLIINLTNSDKNLRELSARILGYLGDKRAVDPLIDLLEDKEEVVRAQAVFSLNLIKDQRAVEPLISAIKDRDFQVKYNAITALGELNDKKAVKPLIEALDDQDEMIRGQAALSLGQLHDPQAAEPLMERLMIEGNYLFPAALDNLDSNWVYTELARDMVPDLIDKLNSDDYRIRYTAASVLGYIKDTRAIEPLKKALNDKNSNVRQSAEKALENINAK